MNRRTENDIAKLAFGDLPAERARELERLAGADPEVRSAMESYKLLREGLRSMTPDVEHELSSQRLREEILRRGLEPKTGFGFRWLFVPLAAAGALALAIFAPRGAQGPTNIVGLDDASSRVAFNAPSEPDSSGPLVAWPSSSAGAAGVADAGPRSRADDKPEPEAQAAPTNSRAAADRPQPSMRVAMKEPADDRGSSLAVGAAAPKEAPTPASADEAGGGLARAAMGAPSLAASPEPDPIIVIQPVRDEATGAYRATEVASASNVLIGS